MSELYSALFLPALHCCQCSTLLCTVVRAGGGGELVSARERGSSSCSAAANFAQPSAEQRGRQEYRAALLWQVVQSLAEQSGPESWMGDGGRWEMGGGLPRSPASLHRSAHGHQSARHQTRRAFFEHLFLTLFPCMLLVLTHFCKCLYLILGPGVELAAPRP